MAGVRTFSVSFLPNRFHLPEFRKYKPPPYEEKISCFHKGGGLYSGNSKFFRKSFSNVSRTGKIPHKVLKNILPFFAENFQNCIQRIYS